MAKPVTYVPRPMGTLDANGQKYLQAELASISQSIKTLAAEVNRIAAVLTAHGLS